MAKKVVIDPGHGGEDPGASANGIVEKDYTLLISQYMADRLTELGIDNALTRDSDVTLDSTTRPKTAQSIFGTGNDVIVVSNHINAGGGDGAEIIYALRNSDKLSSKIASEFIKSGQNVRKYYQRRLPSNSSKDYYYMLRETPNNESIIVEYGFLDSTGDDVNQIKNNWQNLAEAVVRALADYIGVAYIPPEGLEEIDDNIYIVKKGDTLYGIANKYGISVDELKAINNLTSNNLSVGQVLQIPEIIEEDVPNENIYIVKSGDTLYSIANKYGMSVQELKDLNKLTSNTLSIGQQLVVSEANAGTLDTYTVKAGDTLYSIANKYGLTVNEIKQLNNLTSDILSIGQVLNISNSNTSLPSNTYIVKSGDSLYSIAKKYGITVDALKSANGKTSNLLSIGEILVIPTTTTTTRTYTVKAGDSLWKIATNYGVSVNALKQANGLSSDLLSIGQVLVIP